ncbi:MAG TPA: HNH endonuclease domain-containing protein [Acidobacteriota bacterium]|nr:HNH endonuclease domain-containing protein [Acidobacteriota bacterium]
MNQPASTDQTIRFAEKMLELLEEGRFVATYKFAVLLALMDLCFEKNASSGLAPESITTRQLAEKTIEIYWPHTVDYHSISAVLRQNTRRQAEIPAAILKFRRQNAPDPSIPLHRARASAANEYERLLRSVEWTLVEMPLPRLQTIGLSRDTFIYEINWDESVRYRDLKEHFDNNIRFKPGVADHLIQLNGLLRPLIHKKWASMVARINKLPESRLEDFLFGTERISSARIRGSLWEIQDRQCFYCEDRIPKPARGEVDHFIPWSRYPDNGIENLVVAHRRCNGDKRDFLAAAGHVENWTRRFAAPGESSEYAQLARVTQWERDPDKTKSAARSLYLRLSPEARLWSNGKIFVHPDFHRLQAALCT